MRSFWVAVGCLTILPLGPREAVEDTEVGGSLLWFPLVGLLIGLGLVGVNVLASQMFPPMVVGACLLLAWIALTGALHLDGVGDVADGCYGGRTREERLRIMKDPHVGAMAVVAIATLLILKFALLSSLPSAKMNRALLLAPCMSRYAMTLLGSTLPYARPGGGTAAAFVRYGTKRAFMGATAMALLAAWMLFGLAGFGFFGVALVGSLALRELFLKALGGVTGDALGAAGEAIEVLLLAAVVLVKV